MSGTIHNASVAQLASLTRSEVFTPVTTLWADVDTRMQPTPVIVQQTEHEIEQHGNWIIGLTYTSVTDPSHPSTVVVSMWTTKPDDAAHEVMVSKIAGFIRSHYNLPSDSPMFRHDCVTPRAIIWDPEEISAPVTGGGE